MRCVKDRCATATVGVIGLAFWSRREERARRPASRAARSQRQTNCGRGAAPSLPHPCTAFQLGDEISIHPFSCWKRVWQHGKVRKMKGKTKPSRPQWPVADQCPPDHWALLSLPVQQRQPIPVAVCLLHHSLALPAPLLIPSCLHRRATPPPLPPAQRPLSIRSAATPRSSSAARDSMLTESTNSSSPLERERMESCGEGTHTIRAEQQQQQPAGRRPQPASAHSLAVCHCDFLQLCRESRDRREGCYQEDHQRSAGRVGAGE